MTPEEQREYRAILLGSLVRGFTAAPFAVLQPAEFQPTRFAACLDAPLLGFLTGVAGAGGEAGQARMSLLACLVEKAEALALGGARRQPGSPEPVALRPVFGRLLLLRGDEPVAGHLPLREVASPDRGPNVFPASPAEIGQLSPLRQACQAAVQSSLRQWDGHDFDVVYTHLLALLHRFGAALACDASADLSDISVYDYRRFASAIAASLYQYHAATRRWDRAAIEAPSEPRCALLVGDLSGIQDYLFDIATTGAGGVARRLRARSFFLQMLAEVAAQQILRAFDLPLANVVMNSGGKFYVLLPQLPDTGARIEKLQGEGQAWLLDQLHGVLNLNLAWTEVADNELAAGAFSGVLKRLADGLAGETRRRLRHALVEHGRWTEPRFVQPGFPTGVTVCQVCRRFPAEHEGDDPSQGLQVCGRCHRDRQLGAALPRAEYVAFYDYRPPGSTACFGWSFRVSDRIEEFPGNPVLVTRLNQPDLSDVLHRPATFRFLANYVPQQDGVPWSFSDIAVERKLAEEERATGLLAVIKADVDYLGQIFQEGLRRDGGPELDLPARVATLSRHLDAFFSGWMNWLLVREFPHVYTVYSGGDDLMLVAPRANALRLVQRVRDEFARLAGNPELTLSAGIAVVKPRLPIAHTALLAAEALKKAKDAGRNRLCVLGAVLQWEDLELIEEAVTLLEKEKEKVPSAFLDQLEHLSLRWQAWRDERRIQGLLAPALLGYSLSRNFKRDSPVFKWASPLVGLPLDDEKRPGMRIMNNLGLIGRWVMLGRRTEYAKQGEPTI